MWKTLENRESEFSRSPIITGAINVPVQLQNSPLFQHKLQLRFNY